EVAPPTRSVLSDRRRLRSSRRALWHRLRQGRVRRTAYQISSAPAIIARINCDDIDARKADKRVAPLDRGDRCRIWVPRRMRQANLGRGSWTNDNRKLCAAAYILRRSATAAKGSQGATVRGFLQSDHSRAAAIKSRSRSRRSYIATPSAPAGGLAATRARPPRQSD